eukprot:CAMPEP_0170512722 /NCGR_PEP_ID=MMETSP0208-20121228/67007_1 /TAXON_ID=197538 /ORGANISM="Strombidium inclinatum, Strain S3" /LENGTH=57 /DNA_ID=CAMNT_0010796383 /DNA_START=402 /DNA_END=575 /DNA_ORIENTATION=-
MKKEVVNEPSDEGQDEALTTMAHTRDQPSADYTRGQAESDERSKMTMSPDSSLSEDE